MIDFNLFKLHTADRGNGFVTHSLIRERFTQLGFNTAKVPSLSWDIKLYFGLVFLSFLFFFLGGGGGRSCIPLFAQTTSGRAGIYIKRHRCFSHTLIWKATFPLRSLSRPQSPSLLSNTARSPRSPTLTRKIAFPLRSVPPSVPSSLLSNTARSPRSPTPYKENCLSPAVRPTLSPFIPLVKYSSIPSLPYPYKENCLSPTVRPHLSPFIPLFKHSSIPSPCRIEATLTSSVYIIRAKNPGLC